MKIVIVVPTYNEAENISLLAERVSRVLPNAHLMLMDDNSPDRTADLAETLFASNPAYANYSVVRRTGPRGLGRAYRDGFERARVAGFDRILQMDADLSHNPDHLPDLVKASLHADLVIGSRYCPGGGVRNWPGHRLFVSRFAVRYVQAIARIPIADATAGFRCWSRHALNSIDLETVASEGYSFQVEMTHRACQAGLTIVEMPIIFTDRRFGHSKISRTVIIELFVRPWRLRFHPWQPSTAVVHGLPSGIAGGQAGRK